MPSHLWEFCHHCQTDTVICGTCGNNVCNGGSGRIPKGAQHPDGQECPDCESAYQLWLATPRDASGRRRPVPSDLAGQHPGFKYLRVPANQG
jgi:hypothetical protein